MNSIANFTTTTAVLYAGANQLASHDWWKYLAYAVVTSLLWVIAGAMEGASRRREKQAADDERRRLQPPTDDEVAALEALSRLGGDETPRKDHSSDAPAQSGTVPSER